MCDAEFMAEPPTPPRYFQWSQATYEWALTEVGFRAFTWYPSEVAPEDVARYGETPLARFPRQLSGHWADLPEVTWGTRSAAVGTPSQNRGSVRAQG